MAVLAAYDVLARALVPVRPAILALRRARGKEDPARALERRGRPSRSRPDGPLVWVHGASIGESLAALGLVEALLARHERLHVLVTTGTVTSAAILAERLPERAFHQYVPVDQPGPVDAFLAHWRPDLALWLESDLWPNLLRRRAARGIPGVLVNARLSDRSFARWQRFPAAARRLLACFERALAQSRRDADRLQALGLPAERVAVTGNLKFAAEPPPADGAALAKLQEALGDRPVWLAASTHPADHGALLAAHAELRRRFPELLLVVAPRHPGTAPELAHHASHAGLTPMLRGHTGAKGHLPDGDTAVYIADTVGELGLLYRLSEIAYVGGALPDSSGAAKGGHNPIEPAALGLAVLFGPQMTSFARVSDALLAAGGALRVDSAQSLHDTVGALLADPASTAEFGAAAREAVGRERDGLLAAVLAELAPVAERAGWTL